MAAERPAFCGTPPNFLPGGDKFNALPSEV